MQKLKNTPKYDKKHKQKNTTREHRRPRFLADRFWGFGRLLKVLDVSRLYFGRLGLVLKVLKGFKLRLLTDLYDAQTLCYFTGGQNWPL